jgi:hypothetical protein
LTKEELLKKLAVCNNGDIETGHADADDALIEFINDEDIAKAFNALPKWYA